MCVYSWKSEVNIRYLFSCFLPVLCVCVCVSVWCACVWICSCLYRCVWRVEFHISLPFSFTLLLFFFFFWDSLSLNLELGCQPAHSYLLIFVPTVPSAELHEFRATSAFLFSCWGPALAFPAHTTSCLTCKGLSLAPLLLAFLLEEGMGTLPLLGRHCTTEPHPQLSPHLKRATFRCLSLWMNFAKSPPHISGFVPGSVNHPCNPRTVCVYYIWLTVALTIKWKILEMSSSCVVEDILWQYWVIYNSSLLWAIALRMTNL